MDPFGGFTLRLVVGTSIGRVSCSIGRWSPWIALHLTISNKQVIQRVQASRAHLVQRVILDKPAKIIYLDESLYGYDSGRDLAAAYGENDSSRAQEPAEHPLDVSSVGRLVSVDEHKIEPVMSLFYQIIKRIESGCDPEVYLGRDTRFRPTRRHECGQVCFNVEGCNALH